MIPLPGHIQPGDKIVMISQSEGEEILATFICRVPDIPQFPEYEGFYIVSIFHDNENGGYNEMRIINPCWMVRKTEKKSQSECDPGF